MKSAFLLEAQRLAYFCKQSFEIKVNKSKKIQIQTWAGTLKYFDGFQKSHRCWGAVFFKMSPKAWTISSSKDQHLLVEYTIPDWEMSVCVILIWENIRVALLTGENGKSMALNSWIDWVKSQLPWHIMVKISWCSRPFLFSTYKFIKFTNEWDDNVILAISD